MAKTVLKSRILIFYDFFPPAYKGGGIIRSVYNLSKFLSDFHEVFVFTSNSDLGDSFLLNVEPNEWIQYSTNLKVFYASKEFQSLLKIYHILGSLKPDVIYINGIFTPRFSIYPLMVGRVIDISSLWVIEPRGMLQNGALAIKSLKKKIYLSIFKQLGFHKMVKWQATDKQEGTDIRRVFGLNCRIDFASNIPEIHTSANFNLDKKEKSLSIVFLALISPVKNLKRLIDLLNQIPDYYSIRLDIYGPVKDPSYWGDCINSIEKSSPHINVTYKGLLDPSDVNPVLKKYHFFSLLSLGENFGHSIFESLNAGTPVIISNKTPWKNLDKYNAGWDMDLKDETKIVSLFLKIADMNQITYNKFRVGARNHAERYVQANDFKKQYEKLFELN